MARSSAHVYVGKLSQMIADAIRVPKNPLLVHFVFESLCVLIKKVNTKYISFLISNFFICFKAYTKTEGGLDKHIIPVIELVIQNDVAEFTPYSLQLIGMLKIKI